MPVTAVLKRAYLRRACIASQSAGKSLSAYLEAVLLKNSALTGRPSIQSTSYGGQSSSYFNPGQGGAMTGSDEAELIEWALCILPGLESALEDELGRPPTPAEICSALSMAVPPGAVEVRNDYRGLRAGCSC